MHHFLVKHQRRRPARSPNDDDAIDRKHRQQYFSIFQPRRRRNSDPPPNEVQRQRFDQQNHTQILHDHHRIRALPDEPEPRQHVFHQGQRERQEWIPTNDRFYASKKHENVPQYEPRKNPVRK